MNKIELKANLHDIIDQLDSVELLKKYYNELKGLVKNSNSKVWENLSSEQQQEILLAYEESESDKNLIDNDSIIQRIKKTL